MFKFRYPLALFFCKFCYDNGRPDAKNIALARRAISNRKHIYGPGSIYCLDNYPAFNAEEKALIVRKMFFACVHSPPNPSLLRKEGSFFFK
jgi:hypothetical protein